MGYPTHDQVRAALAYSDLLIRVEPLDDRLAMVASEDGYGAPVTISLARIHAQEMRIKRALKTLTPSIDMQDATAVKDRTLHYVSEGSGLANALHRAFCDYLASATN